MRNLKVNKGFSLVELMVAIMIIGVVIALSIPAFGRFMRNWRLNGSAEQLASTLRTARSAAVMKNIDAVFQFDMNLGTYFYFEDLDGDGTRDGNEYKSATFELSNGVSFQGHTLGSTIIKFGPKGNTSSSGTITLVNTDDKTRTVRIFGGTGNISLD